MEIIGLSGFARAGKDETAKVLVEEFGFVQIAFADKLREMLYALNPIVAVLSRSCTETIREGWEPTESQIYLQDVIDTVGWDGYKETKVGPEIRRLLQRLGTEAGRKTLWDTIWIDATLANLDADAKVVVSDARFFNEFDAIKDRGGKIWRITRDGVGPANNHPSELEASYYDEFDYYLLNNGSLEGFKQKVREAYESGSR